METINIKTMIIGESINLNECIKKWYNKHIPDDLEEFTGCCNEDETNMLIKCYNIIREKSKLDYNKRDIIQGLVAYYYNAMILENYVQRYSDEKYLKIVNDIKESPEVDVLIDNDDIEYLDVLSEHPPDAKYVRIYQIFSPKTKFYVNKDRTNDPYIYKDNEGKKKVLMSTYINCIENMFKSKMAKDIYNLCIHSDEEWASEIRRLVLNMNTEPFEGYKGGKHRTNCKHRRKSKKNRRKSKKNIRKSRKI